jgi:hypothetical protein
MVVFLALSIVAGILMHNYRRFRFDQAEASFQFFTFIPNQLIEKMKDYYMTVRQQVVEKELLAEVDRHEDKVFAIDSQEVSKVEDGRFSSFSKVKLINHDRYYHWVAILVFVMAFNGFNYLATDNIYQFFHPSTQIIDKVNLLMRGENRLLEGYFELKANYYLNPSTFSPAVFSQIEAHLSEYGRNWTFFANDLAYSLDNYDPSFSTNFNNILVSNICNLSASALPTFMQQ